VRLLPWSHNLIILNQSQRSEEREFYVRQSINEKWGKRELERQFKTALFERTMLSPAKVSAVVTQMQPDALSVFKDSYLVEFLDLPLGHTDADLHQGLLQQLKQFLIELGREVKRPHEPKSLHQRHQRDSLKIRTQSFSHTTRKRLGATAIDYIHTSRRNHHARRRTLLRHRHLSHQCPRPVLVRAAMGWPDHVPADNACNCTASARR